MFRPDQNRENPWLNPDAECSLNGPKRRRGEVMNAMATRTATTDPLIIQINQLLDQIAPTPVVSKRYILVSDPMKINKERKQEKSAIGETESSSFDAGWVFSYIHLGNVTGKRILEIGGGGSDASIALRNQGAEVFTIDYRYRDLRALSEAVISFNSERYADRNYLDPATHQSLKQNFGRDNYLITHLPTTSADKKANARKLYDKGLQTLISFLENQQYSRGLNLSALSGELPFARRAFDDVFSYLAISSTQAHYPEVFLRSVRAGREVLRRGGLFQIAPWGPEGIPTDSNGNDQGEIIQMLEHEGISYQYRELSPGTGTLVIFN